MKNKKIIIGIIVLIIIIIFCNYNSKKEEKNNIIENNITNTNEETIQEPTLDVESTGEIFYYVLCNDKNLEKKEPQIVDNYNVYESANLDYNIEIISDKETDKIISIRLMSFTDDIIDCRNFFCKLTELNYSNTDNDIEIISFIVDNIGKNATKQIKNMNFELSVGTSGKPIITINANK